MGVRSNHRRGLPMYVAQSFDDGAPVAVEGRTMTAPSLPPTGGYEVPRSGWPAMQVPTVPPAPTRVPTTDPPTREDETAPSPRPTVPDDTEVVSPPAPQPPGHQAPSEDELIDDLKKIIEEQGDGPTPQPTQQPAPADPPSTAAPGPSASARQAANRTRIFDEIAASMSHARSYDLGSVALEHRFDEFDQAEDDQLARRRTGDRSPAPAAASAGTLPPPPPPATAVAATEFVEDLDAIRSLSDIPLDPGVGGRSIGESALEAGDVILSTTDHPISETIRKVTGAEVSHAALYVGNGKVVEAIEGGVILRSLETALDEDTLAVAYRHRDMTPVKASQMVAFAEDHARKKTPFDNWGLIQVAPGQLARAICNQKEGADREECLAAANRLRVGTNDEGAFFCSELVLAAFQHAGLALTDTDPSWSSPGQIVELHHNGLFDYVGHLKA